MPQTVTFQIKTTFKDGGPNIPPLDRANKVSANTAIMEEVLNDKNWHEYEVLAGNRDQIEYLILAADRYQDEHCPRPNEPGLLFKFDEMDEFVLQLDRPLLYSGHTASCLPQKIENIYIQNRMAEKVKFYLLVGRKQKVDEKKPGNGQVNAPAATKTP